MSQEIDLYNNLQNPIAAIETLGAIFAKSGMFGCEKVEQGQVLAWACIAERKTPLEIKRRYHLQNGELSVRADAMLADFRSICKGTHKVIERSPAKAAVELTLDGNSQTFSFTWAEAEKEPFVLAKDGKLKKNYATPRARMQMLWARVISDAVRTMAPEIVSGTYTPEELDDDAQSRPAKELLPSQPAAPAAEKRETKPANVSDVRTVSAEEASATPPPEPNSNTAAAAAQGSGKPIVHNWASAKNPKKISVEAVNALMEIIPTELHNAANKWLEEKQWIPPMGSLSDLSPARAQKIYEETETFLGKIKG